MTDIHPEPPCPFGHGPMQRQAGWWALTGVSLKQPGALMAAAGARPALTTNDKAMALQVWTCSHCKAVQLFEVPPP